MSIGTALVTGCAQGIGRAVALRLADDGFDIAVNDFPSSRPGLDSLVAAIAAKGRRAFAVPADVSREEEVMVMVASAVEHFGGLDVMVANAGICQYTGSVIETSEDSWDAHFNTNIRGAFFCWKYAGIQMIAQGRGGRLIGASSVAGKIGTPSVAPYVASKFALRGLSQSMAQEMSPHRITVNTYAPGCIDTPLWHSINSTFAKEFKLDVEVTKANFTANSALGYIGQVDDVASLVSYIASKESHFITGQAMSPNGGMHLD
ncbi:NAD(P)-binding protein [Athelia psychrophila]|uniref:NAD(P)-binding protein n=1 Tax=Athelia psychrophila TaxID=1759441 RepID=A0A166RUN1_9AGAM|nr:NAD(P)-binding protein [Fibularhizoctonia sp. CBS 109695]